MRMNRMHHKGHGAGVLYLKVVTFTQLISNISMCRTEHLCWLKKKKTREKIIKSFDKNLLSEFFTCLYI